MELTWYGHSCFRFTERGMASVVCDPYDHHAVGGEPLKLKADIATVSHDRPGHNFLSAVKGDPYTITGPGEYEIGGVFITGIQTNGVSKKNEGEPRNTLYVIEYVNITVVHLGAINRVPTQAEVEALGPVHIALIPVGGGGGLNSSKAAEVISLLEPNIVIPMHYDIPGNTLKLDSVHKFIKEMGLADVPTQPTLKIGGPSALPDETKVIVLEHQRS